MSMFKSLQHIPSTISVFHSPSSQVSVRVLALLQKHSVPHTSKPHISIYNLDITPLVPTREQFTIIKDSIKANEQNKLSFTKLFPKFSIDLLPDAETFAQEMEHDNKSKFIRPLVVDWDHGLLATDEKSVQEILKIFETK